MHRLKQIAFAILTVAVAIGEVNYQKPPKEILEVLNALATPVLSVNPTRTHALLIQSARNPPIADLAQPMLRLAGLRINPLTNGPHAAPSNIAMTLRKLDGGPEIALQLPRDVKASMPRWSGDGQRFAFTNTTRASIDLWIGDTATGQLRKIDGVRLNAILNQPGPPTQRVMGSADAMMWMPDNHTLLLRLVPANRGTVPTQPAVPLGPHVQESSGRAGPIRTYEDMLSNPHDEDLFDYYATSQLALLDIANGKLTNVGRPAIFEVAHPSPDGNHILTARIRRPYSYLHPVHAFPKEVAVWDRSGNTLFKLATLPLADRVPIDGVPTGPRSYGWKPADPATLVWVEAMDGGNPKETVPHRDHGLLLQSPFTGSPSEYFKTVQRFTSVQFGQANNVALVTDYERNRRWTTTSLIDTAHPEREQKLLFSRNIQDRYKDPGTPVMRVLSDGHVAIQQSDQEILLRGLGASPQGDRPFLDRFNLKTAQSERLFHSDSKNYETAAAVLDDRGTRFITVRESPSEPPNYYLRVSGASPSATALTHYPDPAPQLRGIKKQLVTYQRTDGVPLSFTLYLPPDAKPGVRLPTVVWAYPLEFNDADTAGQIAGSTQRLTNIVGASHLFFLLRGYAILDNAAMPVVGSAETVNNTYLEQIVMDAKAAIDKAVEMGVTDPDRVGVGGHSYGAFMTANLLAHSNLFRAGIARSGAYNRTLTPFGFQTERRTIWESPEVYIRMSPFLNADKIKAPLLMIHGEADDNTGTFPIQSERMYQAIRGNGGTVRLVMLPNEAHGYRGRESVEHTLYEMIAWFDKYVKDAPKLTSSK